MTKLLGNLEEYIKVSYEVEESHTSVIKVVHQFLGDMHRNIESIGEESRVGAISRLVEHIVREGLRQSIDKVEGELKRLGDVTHEFQKAILNIDELRSIIGEASVINPKTNLSFIIQNQVRLIKNLPELHALR